MNFIHSDGGREAAGFKEEKNDCAVRAYAITTGLDYAEAHRLLELWGRKQNTGTRLITFIASDKNFFPHIFIDCRGIYPLTVNKFMTLHTKGKFIVAIQKHAFAVIDGTIHDTYEIPGKVRIKFFIHII